MHASVYKSAKGAVFCVFYSPYLHGKRIQYNPQHLNCQEKSRKKPPIFTEALAED